MNALGGFLFGSAVQVPEVIHNPLFSHAYESQLEETIREESAPTNSKLNSFIHASTTCMKAGALVALFGAAFYVSTLMPEVEYTYGFKVEM